MNYNSTSILSKKLVHLICEHFIQILDINLIPVKQINHSVENFKCNIIKIIEYFRIR